MDRLADRDFDRWALDALMDAFEPAALAAMAKADKARAPAAPTTKGGRQRMGAAPAAPSEEPGHD